MPFFTSRVTNLVLQEIHRTTQAFPRDGLANTTTLISVNNQGRFTSNANTGCNICQRLICHIFWILSRRLL